jgi:hypothetical protein
MSSGSSYYSYGQGGFQDVSRYSPSRAPKDTTPKEFYKELNAKRESIGGEKLTEKAFKTGLTQKDPHWSQGTIFKSEEHATAAIVDAGIHKILEDKGYDIRAEQQVGEKDGKFVETGYELKLGQPEVTAPVPEGYSSWDDYTDSNNIDTDNWYSGREMVWKPGFEVTKEDLKLTQMLGDGSKPQISQGGTNSGDRNTKQIVVTVKYDKSVEKKIRDYEYVYNEGKLNPHASSASDVKGGGGGECCIFNAYGGGGCGPCNRGGSLSRIIISNFWGVT